MQPKLRSVPRGSDPPDTGPDNAVIRALTTTVRYAVTSARSRISRAPVLCAQCAQQYIVPLTSDPCPMIRVSHSEQVGASA
jgi:hypothetical protein